MDDKVAIGDRRKLIQQLIQQLPKANVQVAKHVFLTLHKIDANKAINLMNSQNLSIVLTLSMLRNPGASAEALMAAVSSSELFSVVETIISDAEFFFPNS